jgi:hypothetical protein
MDTRRSLRFGTLVAPLAFASALTVSAQDSGFGLGLMIGEPTGLSMKTWVASDRALAFGLAWGLNSGRYLHVHADYLWHKMELIQVNKGKLPLYFGPGLRLRAWRHDDWHHHHGHHHDEGAHDHGHVDLGIRFPVGLAYLFENAPFDVFLEVAPTLDLFPDSDVDFDAAIGGRFWF